MSQTPIDAFPRIAHSLKNTPPWPKALCVSAGFAGPEYCLLSSLPHFQTSSQQAPAAVQGTGLKGAAPGSLPGLGIPSEGPHVTCLVGWLSRISGCAWI